MKLLFDQNISYRILGIIESYFPDSVQVRRLNLENKSDKEIWSFAKQNDFTIVTFDSDFSDLLTLYGTPPKVIWLRTGNVSLKDLSSILIKHSDTIKQFVESSSEEDSCLQIFK